MAWVNFLNYAHSGREWPQGAQLLDVDVTRASLRLDRRAAAIDRSVDVVLVGGAMRSHRERWDPIGWNPNPSPLRG